jgi:hypothetical protein
MKNLITLTGVASTCAVLALMSACETTGTAGGAASQQGQAAASTGGRQATMNQLGEQQMAGQSLYPTLEGAGPDHIEVQQFGGFGPMGVNAMGDW